MRTTTITHTYKIYTFDELSEGARNKAINDLIESFQDYGWEYLVKNLRPIADAIEKAEQMQTPWFAPSYIFDECYDNILLPILQDEEFLETGEQWFE